MLWRRDDDDMPANDNGQINWRQDGGLGGSGSLANITFEPGCSVLSIAVPDKQGEFGLASVNLDEQIAMINGELWWTGDPNCPQQDDDGEAQQYGDGSTSQHDGGSAAQYPDGNASHYGGIGTSQYVSGSIPQDEGGAQQYDDGQDYADEGQ